MKYETAITVTMSFLLITCIPGVQVELKAYDSVRASHANKS